MERKQKVTGYYRSWCNTLALFYDTLTGVLGLFVGGEQRFREKIVAAANLHPGDKVLDVGCGTGTLTVLMAERVGAEGEVVGVDLSQRMLAAARRKANHPNLIFREANAEAIPYPEGYFDVVTATYILHEMQRRGRECAMNEIRRVLRKNGRLVVVDMHEPKSYWRRGVFRLLMLWEDETAWDLVRNGLQKELSVAGFQHIRQTFLYRDFVPVTLAINA